MESLVVLKDTGLLLKISSFQIKHNNKVTNKEIKDVFQKPMSFD
jgi:hypothetical protein